MGPRLRYQLRPSAHPGSAGDCRQP